MLNEFSGKTTILFVSTCSTAQCLTYMLRNLGFKAVCLHGQMPQPSASQLSPSSRRARATF